MCWGDRSSSVLRNPMYEILRKEYNSWTRATKALQYACLCNGHPDDKKNGNIEYMYGVQLLDKMLEGIALKKYLLKDSYGGTD